MIKFLLRYIHPKNYLFFILMIDVGILCIGMLSAPLLVSFVVDHVISNEMITSPIMQILSDMFSSIDNLQDNLWIFALLIVLAYSMVALGSYLKNIHGGMMAETFGDHVRKRMIQKIETLYYSEVKLKDSGDLLQRATSDVETIRRFLMVQFSEMMWIICNVMISCSILFSLHTTLAFISICLIPLILLTSYLFFCRVKKIFTLVDEAESDMTSILSENLNGVRVVKAFHQENREIKRFEEKNQFYQEKSFELMHTLAIFWSSTDFLGMMQILLMIICGVSFALDNHLSVGTFFVFLMYESSIVWPLRQLGRILADFGKVSVSCRRIQEILHMPSEEFEGKQLKEIQSIELKNVCFKYNDATLNTLYDINLKMHAHQKIAIMGPTGSGKSSLIHLLNRIYDVNAGEILINGESIQIYNKQDVRRRIQVVLQEPFLFSKTIMENIRCDCDVNDEDVYHFAKLACIHDDIMHFKDGYQTLVGEKGVTLSGGQKQRIAIARALLRNSDILILDDSLSALDTQTDVAIQQALEVYDQGLIMITHRISSSKLADLIIVLDQGRIVQSGTYESLMKEDGLYRQLAMIQQGGEIYES